MSKSLGNVIAPQEIIEKYGADILRLWVASTDYRNDIRISDQILSNLVESYRRIRNTARFLLGNLSDFNPSTDRVTPENMLEFDRWILQRTNRLIHRATKGYEDFEFHLPTYMIHHFCVNELSSVYLDVCKDRLYAEDKGGVARKSCQTAMWFILDSLTRLLAPVLSFTAEEIWQEMRKIETALPESVFLSSWPGICEDLQDRSWTNDGMKFLPSEVPSAGLLNLPDHQAPSGIPSMPRLRSLIRAGGQSDRIPLREEWATLSIVSSFKKVDKLSEGAFYWKDQDTGLEFAVRKAPGGKCPRCWKREPGISGEEVCPRCQGVLERMDRAL